MTAPHRDKRARFGKADAPHRRGKKAVTAYFDPEQYAQLYALAKQNDISLAEAIRSSVNKMCQILQVES